MKGFFQGLSATCIHVTVQTPGCLGVVESRPCAGDQKLLRILVLHPLVEIFQMIFAPLAAIVGPPFFAGANPDIKTVQRGGVLSGIILIYKQRRRGPVAHMLANEVPVGLSTLRKNENDRPVVVCDVSTAIWGLRTDV